MWFKYIRTDLLAIVDFIPTPISVHTFRNMYDSTLIMCMCHYKNFHWIHKLIVNFSRLFAQLINTFLSVSSSIRLSDWNEVQDILTPDSLRKNLLVYSIYLLLHNFYHGYTVWTAIGKKHNSIKLLSSHIFDRFRFVNRLKFLNYWFQ